MMTFVLAVAGGIMVANLVWTAIMIALFMSKRVRKWMMKLGFEYSKECLEQMEELEEEL